MDILLVKEGMNKYIRSLIMAILILSTFMLKGQNPSINKLISIKSGKFTLKEALVSISNQTGCVFSYDPIKIDDKHLISIPEIHSQNLRSALKTILPKNIQFKLNGKYIVLIVRELKNSDKKVNSELKQTQIINTIPEDKKTEGRIDKNPELERLVLPSLNDESISSRNSQPAQTVMIQPKDSITTNEKSDSIFSPSLMIDTISKNKSFQPNISISDSTRIEKSGFSNFIKKNSLLETGISLSKQLSSISIRAGVNYLYSIFSISSDHYKSYLLGFGIGSNFNLNKHLDLNIDLLRSTLIAGKSYLLDVRASNTQLIPLLNYKIWPFLKISAGPTFNIIKSSYINSISTTDLGLLVGIGYSIGIKIDIKNLLTKEIKK